MSRLAGIMFCLNPIKWDYCWRECIENLQAMCDNVVILDAGSDDGTREELLQFEDQNTFIVSVDRALWDLRKDTGKERIAYFQNLCLPFADADYYYLQQADEITPEWYFPQIREAMYSGGEAFMITRVNLWGDANHYVNVPQNRQPCSQKVIRLAKVKYQSTGDGESIDAPANFSFVDKIKMYHYGFVRKKEVMKGKIMNMQESVFNIDHDPKLDTADTFDSKLWFSGDELSPIEEPHSKFIQTWIKTRP